MRFSVSGKWGLSVTASLVEVPNVVQADRHRPQGQLRPEPRHREPRAAQELLRLQSAVIEMPALRRHRGDRAADGRRDGRARPDRVGGRLPARPRRADLQAGPDAAGAGRLGHRPTLHHAGHPRQLPAGKHPGAQPAPQTICFGGILEFDDLRIGVDELRRCASASADHFDGTIYFASGGVKFLPGKPVSATITDRLTAEPGDIAPDCRTPRPSARRSSSRTARSRRSCSTPTRCRSSSARVLTITARDFTLDTGAEADEELVSFGSVGAEVKIGALVIGGEARNFAFLGDGSFETKPGFGVFLSVGGADGGAFKWPSWLPIRINAIGIEWPDIQADPGELRPHAVGLASRRSRASRA